MAGQRTTLNGRFSSQQDMRVSIRGAASQVESLDVTEMKKRDYAKQNRSLGHERLVSHRGIEFHGTLYNSPELVDLRLREGTPLAVEVRPDSPDAGTISVRIPTSKAPLHVPALKS